ncbi:transposase [Leisingera methylohalidivorans]|uniref:transposase n=1 Tax=Leisingera methylohalidivorans TaxID=133924 RepID=UPI0003F71996|nr:transposase [Leisingera methylohalidivorans]
MPSCPAHLIPKCPHADLFNKRGRDWLNGQPVPEDERAAIARHIREPARLGADLAQLGRDIAQDALEDEPFRRLLAITGVNPTVASGLMAAIISIARFASPQKLVSYFGLNPRGRQPGLEPAQHSRISKAGRSHARAMLAGAAWAGAKALAPLHAFFVRIRAHRGHQISAVAEARKLATLCWHMLTKAKDYRWVRPSLLAHKRRPGLNGRADRLQSRGAGLAVLVAGNAHGMAQQINGTGLDLGFGGRPP